LLDDVVDVLTTDENASHRTRIADARGEPAPRLPGGGAVGEIGTMALASVNDQQPALAGCLEHALGVRHGAAEKRHVVAEGFTEAARVHEVTLEIDHHEGGGRYFELVLVGLRVDE